MSAPIEHVMKSIFSFDSKYFQLAGDSTLAEHTGQADICIKDSLIISGNQKKWVLIKIYGVTVKVKHHQSLLIIYTYLQVLFIIKRVSLCKYVSK